VGVSGFHGTNSGPLAYLERGCEPAGGASILPRAAFLSFVRWDSKAVAQYSGYVVARDSRGSLRCSERLAEPSRAVVPHGCYCAAKVTGPKAIMTMILN
jgi:hypothetical protein